MSTAYNLEPPTRGKVLLKTSAGELEIELWPKEAPKAVRNFVQLCLEGYYDGCIFHRIIPGFIAQTGDPTGSGTGGESVYGAPFADEFHSRLRFTHRGLVACANQNEPHTNTSQFFVTLDKCEGLNKKHTIFGRVVGDTIFNLVAIGETEVEDDRPVNPPVVTGAEVLWNPFEDIVPRKSRQQQEEEAQRAAEAAEAAKPRKKKRKDLKLLSFGEEAEGEEAQLAQAADAAAPRIRSAHDLGTDDRLVKPDTADEKRLEEVEAAAAAERAARLAGVRAALAKKAEAARPPAAAEKGPGPSGAAAVGEGGSDGEEEDGFDERMRAKMLAKRRAMGDDAPQRATKKARSDSNEDSESGDDRKRRRKEERQSIRTSTAAVLPSRQLKKMDFSLLSAPERRREELALRKKLTGSRQADTMAKLAAFTARLRDQATAAAQAAPAEKPQAPGGGDSSKGTAEALKRSAPDEGYNGRVRDDIDHDAYKPAAWRVDDYLDEESDEEAGGRLAGLATHRLTFAKNPNARDEMARKEDADDYVVVDPLLEAGKQKYNKQQAQRKKHNREWNSARPAR